MMKWWQSKLTISYTLILLLGLCNILYAQLKDISCRSLNPKLSSWNKSISYEIRTGGGPMTLQCTSNRKNLTMTWYQCSVQNCRLDKIRGKLSSPRCIELRDTQNGTVNITTPNHSETGCIAFKTSTSDLAAVKYEFTDICSIPSPKYPVIERHTCSISDKQECRVSPPKLLKVSNLSLTTTAFPEVFIQWQHHHKESHFYGYAITLSSGSSVDEVCLTTIYDKGDLNRTSFRVVNGQNHLNLNKIFKLRNFERNYILRIASLPASDIAKITFEIPSANKMCQMYKKQYNKTLLHCYFVKNLTLNEKCDKKQINITWTLPDDLPLNKFKSYINLTIDGKEIQVSHHENYHVINTTRKHLTVSVQLVDSERFKAHGVSISKYICKSTLKPVTSSPIVAATKKIQNKTAQNLIITVGVIGSLIFLFVATIWIFIWYFRHRKGKSKFVRLISADTHYGNEESALLVYPGGCVLLEEFVAAIAATLQSMEIKVYSECTNSLDAAPNIAGFYAHYSEEVTRVILICTEPVTTENPYHNPFVYVYSNMIQEQCMRKSDRNRFLAIYLSPHEKEKVPLLLRNQSFLIPNDFEKFLLAIYGLKSWPGYKNDIPSNLDGCEIAKDKLLSNINKLQVTSHPECSKSSCKHGDRPGDDFSRVMSMSELTEQHSQYTIQRQENNNDRQRSRLSSECGNYDTLTDQQDGSPVMDQRRTYMRAISYRSQTSQISAETETVFL